ncbi:MAG: glycosyl transferase family 1 [Naasia sp.]|nr:glycosyl transferase family 1 [Naasia sp.]
MTTSSPVRTAVIAHPSAELYGSDRVMLETVTALTDAGWRVLVATPSTGPLHGEIRARGGVPLIVDVPVLRKSSLRPLGLVRLALGSALAFGRILGLLRRSRADVVYVSTLTQPMWVFVARAARRPVLVHVHEAEREVARPIRWGLAFPLLAATRIVANSRFSLDVVTAEFPRLARRSAVVYNGVPGPAAIVPPRETLEGGLRVVYVGRLSPRKGVDLAVDAVARLLGAGVPARLELVGAVFPGYEWYEEQLRVQAAPLGERVVFRGFEPAVWARLAAADVAVVPSRVDEPFGNTAVEAALSARPVVVARSGGLPEAVAGLEAATLVPPDEAQALADALAALAADWPAARTRALRDADAAAARFAPPVYRAAVLEEFAALLPGHRPPSAGHPAP